MVGIGERNFKRVKGIHTGRNEGKAGKTNGKKANN